MARVPVFHVITGLETGGAERALYRLLASCPAEPHDYTVFSLNGRGTLGDKIEALGIKVVDLQVRSVWNPLPGYRRLLQHCSDVRPAIIQGWMYHANLAVSAVAMRLGGETKTIWGIRGSLHDRASFRPTTRFLIRVGGALSKLPDAIVFNSDKGARMHQEIGYRADCIVTIPNGFDARPFDGDNSYRDLIREQYCIGSNDVLVGSVGRFHYAKGSDLFVRMAGRVAKLVPRAHFLCVGRGMTAENSCLKDLIVSAGIEHRFHLAGDRDDIPQLLSAMDVFVNPSRTEGFPNALAEAMLAGLPCVATDVGDTRKILTDSGSVIASGDISGLAKAVVEWSESSAEQRYAAGNVGRERIVRDYSLERCTERYLDLYEQVLGCADAF